MAATTIGQIIKQIRQKRGYTAKAMYDHLMSRANYARLEDGEIDTSAENLYELTKRLNISMPEWNQVYNENLGRDTGGKTTVRVNQLLNEGWVNQDPKPLREAAQLCYQLFAKYHYPNERLSGLTADALATYLENGQDKSKANDFLVQIIAYLDRIDTWYSNDVGLMFNVLQILDVEMLMKLVTRYLYMVKNNRWLAQGSAYLPSEPEVIQQCFWTTIQSQDFNTFKRLLDYFNAIPMSERYIYPTLMRQMYRAFAQYAQDHDQKRLDQTIQPVGQVLSESEMPSNHHEFVTQVAALRQWLIKAE
ncbi:helix-turn-helix domain-containing protein [Lacticaseibacillus hegangensis]|uniref:Helix-turn-helix domain-containing protein n=1 Tax=Lacticaseibacillus hegangensis TaxID=2486010 RepID=A0ABW4CWI7_9LACO|nr:helix-turn-helix transcriptional regulator [Lacticaseibacillus hegangensis]